MITVSCGDQILQSFLSFVFKTIKMNNLSAPYTPTDVSPSLTPAPVPVQNTAQAFHNVLHRMLAVDSKVSDLIFSPGRPPQVELTGDLQGVPIPGLEMLKPQQIKAMADLMLSGNEQGLETHDKKGSSD